MHHASTPNLTVQVRTVTPKEGEKYELHVRTVTLRSGDFHEELELMGRHASSKIREGDVLAARKVCMKEWNHKRLMYTEWVTHIEINPIFSETCVKPEECSTEGTATKKAAGMKEMPNLAVQAVNFEIATMKSEMEAGNRAIFHRFWA